MINLDEALIAAVIQTVPAMSQHAQHGAPRKSVMSHGCLAPDTRCVRLPKELEQLEYSCTEYGNDPTEP